MNLPFLMITQTVEGWQAVFAYQVFHLPAEEWLKMRWGFNAGALLDEALDRYKLFIESQAVNQEGFLAGTMQNNTLAMRGVHSPESGLQMVLLGRSFAATMEEAQQAAKQYAREIFSTFPHDFLLAPAKTENEYRHLTGEDLLAGNLNIVQIQRGMISLPTEQGPRYLAGLWQASPRSNEQIWRALSVMPQAALFNIAIQPSVLYDGEKHALLDLNKSISNPRPDNERDAFYVPWVESYLKRRLAAWKKFFLVQIHLIADEGMENLIRSIGSAMTRDGNEMALPGYQTLYPGSMLEDQQWRENIRSLELIQNSQHLDEVADLDEVFSVFRFPYRPDAGLPGANFKTEPPPGQ